MPSPIKSVKLVPDPVLSASLYCDHHLDPVIRHFVLPLRRELESTGDYELWWLRYGKWGRHVKLRLHGPDREIPRLRDLIECSAAAFFDALGPSDEADRRARQRRPSLDSADTARSLHPDRSLLWTRYFRSPVCLGDRPWIDDDRYVVHMVRCWARTGDRALAVFEPHDYRVGARLRRDRGAVPGRSRQGALLEALVSGLNELPGPLRSAYLVCHRDELLRFAAVRGELEAEKATEHLVYLDRRADEAGSVCESLRQLARAQWDSSAEASPEGLDGTWQQAIADLLGYVAGFAEDPDYRIDPFAADPSFTPLFKVFHGLANQLGLTTSQEAFACHLLLRAVDPKHPARQRITLLPGMAPLPGQTLHRAILAPEAPANETMSADVGAPIETSEEIDLTDDFSAPGTLVERYEWLHFVGLNGEAGKRWLEEYLSPPSQAIWEQVQEAFRLLRLRRFEEGHDLLREARDRPGELGLTPSVAQAHERRFHGAMAYYAYVTEDFDQAIEHAEAGRAAIIRGIDLDRRLLPSATDCIESTYQQLRIARNQHHWQTMEELIDRARRMIGNEEPLCVLADGTPVHIADIKAYYDALPPLTEEERRSLRGIYDHDYRFHRFFRLIWKIYSLPGQAIP